MKSLAKDRAQPVVAVNDATADAFFAQQSGTFFRRVDWAAFWTSFLVTLGVYVLTLAPTVTLEDSGELAVAPDYLGVPHPPGYPIWTLLTWFFQWIFGWVRYQGQPNPAWSVGLASAVFGALACGVLGLLISRSGGDMLRGLKKANEVLGYETESLFCWAGGVAGGLLLAFSPVMWSQSVIVEVYSLNALFQTLVMLFLYRWMSRPKEDESLYILAFLFGLGLTNHQTLMFMGLALAVAVMLKDIRLFRDFAIVGGGLLVLVLINMWAKSNNQNTWLWIQGPGSTAFWVYTALFVLIPVAGLMLPRGRTVCVTFLLVWLGVSFYLFMPFSSEQNPPINWGYPRTWEGFMHAVTRGQYEKITLSDIFSLRFLQQVGAYLHDMRSQFTLPIALAGFLPFCAWEWRGRGRRYNAFLIATALVAAATVLIFAEAAASRFSGGLAGVLQIGWRLLVIGELLLTAIGVLTLFLKFILPVFQNRREDDGDLFGIRFEMPPALQRWMIASLIAFISLGVIFIAFQNPQLDVQTLFIGRVQFIQSHAVYAIWLGYGLIYLLSHVEILTRGRKVAKMLGIALTAMLPLILIYQNYFDEEQVDVWGGAEQNGHDFGWQFGLYQLRGEKGIESDLRHKLDPETFEQVWAEYPTPGYPPEMGTNAVFYGGTDPGRFVPTYMIYCARVRPDVYLITQNALADNTYMSVMRDLYGDTIWIPSQQDSNYAFQKYVEDVQSGRVAPGADVSFENGRVSVQGVQGVMLINGILAKMIFEANKQKHDFYVEESYVIPWMYPYLEPHGLIMKINKDPLPGLTPEMVKNDHDFWTWYTERLLSNWKFRHDVVARKTFSKLRSAIAGLYAYRRMYEEAEFAFEQAVDLYPLSPEANFRLADVYMQQRKFKEARALIEQFMEKDPMNDKVASFLDQIRGLDDADRRRGELEEQFSGGSGDINAALELAQLYRQMNMEQQFVGLTMNILNDGQIPPSYILAVAQLYAEAQRIDLLAEALRRYVAKEPGNPNAWIDLAAAESHLNKKNEALQALQKAVELGGDPMRDRARTDPRFDNVRNTEAFRKMVPPAPAGGFPLSLPARLPGI